MEARCISPSLEQSRCLYIFPLCSSKAGFVKSDAFDKSLLDPGSSSPALEGVDRRCIGSSGGRTS